MNFIAAPTVAAPVLVFAYGVIRILDGLDGERGPGPAWTAGHLAFLAALALFVPILWGLRRMAGPGLAPTSAAAVAGPGLPPSAAAVGGPGLAPSAAAAVGGPGLAPSAAGGPGLAPSAAAVGGPGLAPSAAAVAGTAGALALAAQFGIDVVVGFAAADHAHMSALFDRVQAVPAVMPIVYTAGPYLFHVGLFALSLLARRGVWLPVLVGVNMLLPLVSKDLLPLAGLCLLAAFWPLRRPAPARTGPHPGGRLAS